MSGKVEAFKNQSYSKLKKECQDSGKLFCDPEFDAHKQSIYHTKWKLAEGVKWLRPSEICDNPKLFVEGADAGDVKQGRLGNCWLVAACSALAQAKPLWKQVIPDPKDQEWDPDGAAHCGIFHFRFCRFGVWQDVVVDDRLPTVNGRLVFARCDTPNEFWAPLLEKAYAKLSGSYESLIGGNLLDALEDFTGGVGESIFITDNDGILRSDCNDGDEARAELHATLEKEIGRDSLMAAAINVGAGEEAEAEGEHGLVKGHAYTVTAVRSVPLATGVWATIKAGLNPQGKRVIDMICCRNPWGKGEWTGAFSDNDPEWDQIPSGEKKRMGLTHEDDGEFWMTFSDFCRYFDEVVICRLVNTSKLQGLLQLRKVWHESSFLGAWKLPDFAGGCANNKETFLQNPQYIFDITKDEDECLVHLMREDRRHLTDKNDQKLTMGIFLCRVENNREYRVHEYLKYERVPTNSPYLNLRSVFIRVDITKGRYLILPTTFKPGCESPFLLRIYTDDPNHARELPPGPTGPQGCCPCLRRTPHIATRIQCVRAQGLEAQDWGGSSDPYCLIKYRGKTVKTRTIPENLNPEWKESAIFYRCSVDRQFSVYVINRTRVGRDKFLGKVKFYVEADCSSTKEMQLKERKKDRSGSYPRTQGSITISMDSASNLTTI